MLSETSLKVPLKKHGIRLTRQRELLFELIHHSHKHLNADQLYELAKKTRPQDQPCYRLPHAKAAQTRGPD